nr:glycoside hydrolase family 3 C-terminal domain-containing protein [Brachyspira sp.]
MRSNESLNKSLELARESIVLLENKNNILPLRKEQKVAIIGPNGNSVRNQLGDYAFKAHVESLVETLRIMANNADNNNATGFTMQERVDLDADILDNFIREIEGVSVYEGVCSKIGKDNVFLSLGSEIFETTDELINEAVETAKKSDVILAILGDRAGLEEGTSSGESRDRSSLNLLPGQDKLLKELKKLGKPIILVLIVGRPVTMPWEKENMDGIICAWLPGEMGGQAIADVLYGDYNPGGKLPVTFPHNIGQIPIYYSHKPSGGAERMWGGYVDGQHEAIYNFGYGLSYTNFELYDFKVDKKELAPTDKINISCKIKNIGKVKGSEVVQLYFRNNVLGVTRPVKELKGFKRVTLEPNQSAEINFEVPIHILGFYDEDMKFVMKKANVDILLGVSSDNILFKETILVNKDEEIKEKVFTTKVNLL